MTVQHLPGPKDKLTCLDAIRSSSPQAQLLTFSKLDSHFEGYLVCYLILHREEVP